MSIFDKKKSTGILFRGGFLVFITTKWRLSAIIRDDLDLDVVCAGVVVEVAFVDAEEEGSVAGGGEFAFGTDIDKIVVVVADDGDQGAGCDVFQQLLVIIDRGYARRR